MITLYTSRIDQYGAYKGVRCVSGGDTALINNCKCMNFNHEYEEDMSMCLAPPRDGSGMAAFKIFAVGK
ncbi:hypothetical protein R6Q59_022070 [Mikania micrantha]